METDPTRICQILVGLPEVSILGVEDVHGAPLVVHIESQVEARNCPSCGRCGWVKDRPVVMLTDLPREVVETAIRQQKRSERNLVVLFASAAALLVTMSVCLYLGAITVMQAYASQMGRF